MFPLYRQPMPDDDRLSPADPDELAYAIAHALRFDGRRHFKTSGEMMAKITAEHLAKCLREAGYVVFKKPPADGSRSVAWGPPRK